MNREILYLTFGVFSLGLGILLNFLRPDFMRGVTRISISLLVVGVVLILIAIVLWKKEDLEPDERERNYKIAEKASYRFFQVIVIILWFFWLFVPAVKWKIAAEDVLFILFFLSILLHAGFQIFYSRKM